MGHRIRLLALAAVVVGILIALAVTRTRWRGWYESLAHRTWLSAAVKAHEHEGEAEGDIHAGEEPDAHAGEAPGAHAGEEPDAHAGEAPGAHAGEEPDAHAGEAPGAHAGEEPDAHAGEAPGAHAGEAPGAHAKPVYDHVHNDATALKLSPQAQQNIGLQLTTVERKPFDRTLSVPATVVLRPGQSQIQCAARFTSIITKIDRIEGEAVEPGMPFCSLQLMHEEVVDAQSTFLKLAEELDVVRREVARLAKVAESGAIPGKTLLEKQYEQERLEGVLRAQRQRLLMHGLADEQIDAILKKRELLRNVDVAVPCENGCDTADEGDKAPHLMKLQKLLVEKGQHVNAGDPLCILADYNELYIEAKAFEQDIAAISNAAAKDWRVTAVFDSASQGQQQVGDLKILTLAGEIDSQSRAFSFIAALPNELARDVSSDGRRWIDWRFRPGQRARLLVPIERWTDRIVLPVDAVVQEGAMSYVFEHNQGHFDRREVRVEYRDQQGVVIADDGALKIGGQVAARGAYQAYLTMKYKSGGAPDPHAGHNH